MTTTELANNDQMYELAHKVRSKGELERFIERLVQHAGLRFELA